MENTNRKYAISRNLGFITGPLFLIMGIVVYMRNENKGLAIAIMIFGVIRIALTVYSYILSRKENQNQG